MPFSETLKLVLPPKGSDEETLAVWRFLIAIFTFLSFAGVIILFILIFGLSPFFAGFAYKSDIVSVDLRMIERDIWDLRIKQCEAINNQNRPALEFATRQISRRRHSFYLLTGREYVIESCQEVGIRINRQAYQEMENGNAR